MHPLITFVSWICLLFIYLASHNSDSNSEQEKSNFSIDFISKLTMQFLKLIVRQQQQQKTKQK